MNITHSSTAPQQPTGSLTDSASGPFRPQSSLEKILWLEPLWLMALMPLILLPGRFLPLAWQSWIVVGLTLFWPLRLLAQRRILPLTPLNWPLFMILLWLPVALWASADRGQSWEAMGYLALGMAFFIALLNWPPTRTRPEWIVWAVVVMGLGLSVLGPALFTVAPAAIPLLSAYHETMHPLIQLLGESINPNILAGGLLIVVPILAALALRPAWTRRRWLPWLSGLVALWVVSIIFLTGSRGALLGVVVALILIVTLRWPRLSYALPLVLIGIFSLLWMVGPQTVLDSVTTNAGVSNIIGLDQRVEIWSRALYALHDFVFTGIGVGTFNLVIPLLYPYFLIPSGIDIPHAHNLLLQVGMDLGLIGLIAYLALLLDLFIILFGVLRRREHSLQWTLAAGILGAFTATLVAGVFDSVNWGSKLAFLPWLLMAAATLIHSQETNGVQA